MKVNWKYVDNGELPKKNCQCLVTIFGITKNYLELRDYYKNRKEIPESEWYGPGFYYYDDEGYHIDEYVHAWDYACKPCYVSRQQS